MHRQWLAVMIVLSSAIAAGSASGDEANVSGHIITRKGRTLTFTRLQNGWESLQIRHGPEDTPSSLPFSRCRSITFGRNSHSAQVVLTNGRQLTIRPGDLDGGDQPIWVRLTPSLEFYTFDEIQAKEVERRCHFQDIAKIVLGKSTGRFRRCTQCSAIWPDSYLFCPHDGARTSWSDAASRPQGIQSAASSPRKPRGIIDAFVNTTLSQAGVRADSSEAREFREFTEIFLDPKSDPKEYTQKLEQLHRKYHGQTR